MPQLVHIAGMASSNHRARVAALRRERMRLRLLEAALSVFGQAADEPGVVDEVISRAKVSRGTFYNYFDNADGLLRAVADAVGTELMQAVAPIVEARDDPAERMGAGVRSWISLVERHPGLAYFFRRAGLYILSNEQVRTDMPRDLVAGMKSRRFTIDELELGFVLVAGTVLAAINTMATGKVPRTYGSKLAERILMSLGVEGSEARAISRARIAAPALSPDSLIVRSIGAGLSAG
ncbi:TetR/AcrR family transcriptional regulator [Sphingomonas sp. RB56-2]|uniref:TetR/AcrR family transcriptional regulator n=1 Tax=Sphingomonas brevis TaxID=2908206 RepID=A0ABT0S8A6_9SPHN|nr:TetR/AcrR family transcriptional regulator [Sphingomonas brevis]MCL6740618.1 TetR/AcrR family transcriptional regulator [Sphingomonas brevis]